MARFDPEDSRKTLFAALLAAAAQFGPGRVAIEDVDRRPMTYRGLVRASLVLGRKLADLTRRGENVAVLLPSSIALTATIFGLNAYGRVVVLLNFTLGVTNLSSALRTGVVRTLVTSRRFVKAANLDSTIEALSGYEISPGRKVRVVYLEDIRAGITAVDKGVGALKAEAASLMHRWHGLTPEQPAVILFTSGTEGSPKGVALSSRNLVANSQQVFRFAQEALRPSDVFLNPLPMFHGFGLTAGTLVPLFNGMKTVLCPSPLRYREVVKMIEAAQATLLLATDTFLQGYARAAEPGQLANVRIVVAGAERVKEGTRALWSKSGTTILEGYGVTECSPVVAVNLPRSNRPGTVGRILPAIEHRLASVPGIKDGGRLSLKGPNVMLGYVHPDAPGVIAPPPDGWHDTGDIVSLDDEGFLTIRGRARRYAKIGGEMVSLAAVELLVCGLWPEGNHVVVGVPDPSKGEQLVLVTDQPEVDREKIQARMKGDGLPMLWLPKSVLVVPAIPMLDTGKFDMMATLEMVRRKLPLL